MPEIIIEGLPAIEKSLATVGPLVYKAARNGLRVAAEPVKRDADRLSFRLSGMKRARKTQRRTKGFVGPLLPAWSIQKIGQTRHEVYIVPQQRGTKGRGDDPRRRPKFTTVMLEKSYDPALEKNQLLVRQNVDAWLTRVIREI